MGSSHGIGVVNNNFYLLGIVVVIDGAFIAPVLSCAPECPKEFVVQYEYSKEAVTLRVEFVVA